jgi:predicted DNA-binding protein (MmcQ/YjbR family)
VDSVQQLVGTVTLTELHKALIAHGLTLPEAWEDHPWGETAIKVRKKIFLFVGLGETLSLGFKLPFSGEVMLALPCAKPMAYGLGRHGWVSLKLSQEDLDNETLSELRLQALVDESFRAVAPKTLAKQVPI